MADISAEELEKIESKVAQGNRGVIATADFVEPEVLFQELVGRIRKYHPNADISMIQKAYDVANAAHKGQCRKSGEPYIIHPLCVAIILADL